MFDEGPCMTAFTCRYTRSFKGLLLDHHLFRARTALDLSSSKTSMCRREAGRLGRSTVKTLLWDTSIQGTPPSRGHKIWSLNNVHIIFGSVTSIQGTPLSALSRERDTFWVTHVIPPSRGHKIWSLNNVHIIFGSVTSIQETPFSALSRKRDTFLGNSRYSFVQGTP